MTSLPEANLPKINVLNLPKHYFLVTVCIANGNSYQIWQFEQLLKTSRKLNFLLLENSALWAFTLLRQQECLRFLLRGFISEMPFLAPALSGHPILASFLLPWMIPTSQVESIYTHPLSCHIPFAIDPTRLVLMDQLIICDGMFLNSAGFLSCFCTPA